MKKTLLMPLAISIIGLFSAPAAFAQQSTLDKMRSSGAITMGVSTQVFMLRFVMQYCVTFKSN
jgi:hypothetical protein